METLPKTWITGEEFARERRRLLDQGCSPEGPEYQELLDRLDDRNRRLFDQHGQPLIETYPGQWIAISESGEVLVGEDRSQVRNTAQDRFGTGNFHFRKLGPATRWHTPRKVR